MASLPPLRTTAGRVSNSEEHSVDTRSVGSPSPENSESEEVFEDLFEDEAVTPQSGSRQLETTARMDAGLDMDTQFPGFDNPVSAPLEPYVGSTKHAQYSTTPNDWAEDGIDHGMAVPGAAASSTDTSFFDNFDTNPPTYDGDGLPFDIDEAIALVNEGRISQPWDNEEVAGLASQQDLNRQVGVSPTNWNQNPNPRNDHDNIHEQSEFQSGSSNGYQDFNSSPDQNNFPSENLTDNDVGDGGIGGDNFEDNASYQHGYDNQNAGNVEQQLEMGQQQGANGYWQGQSDPPHATQAFALTPQVSYQTHVDVHLSVDGTNRQQQQYELIQQPCSHVWNGQQNSVMGPTRRYSTPDIAFNTNSPFQMDDGEFQISNGGPSRRTTTEPPSSPAAVIHPDNVPIWNLTDYSMPFSRKPNPKPFKKAANDNWDEYTDEVPEFFTSPFPEFHLLPEDPNQFLPAVINVQSLSPWRMLEWFARAPQHRDLMHQFVVPRLTGFPNEDPRDTSEEKQKKIRNNTYSMRQQRLREHNGQFMGDAKIARVPKGMRGKALTKVFAKGLLPKINGAQLLHVSFLFQIR